MPGPVFMKLPRSSAIDSTSTAAAASATSNTVARDEPVASVKPGMVHDPPVYRRVPGPRKRSDGDLTNPSDGTSVTPEPVFTCDAIVAPERTTHPPLSAMLSASAPVPERPPESVSDAPGDTFASAPRVPTETSPATVCSPAVTSRDGTKPAAAKAIAPPEST